MKKYSKTFSCCDPDWNVDCTVRLKTNELGRNLRHYSYQRKWSIARQQQSHKSVLSRSTFKRFSFATDLERQNNRPINYYRTIMK